MTSDLVSILSGGDDWWRRSHRLKPRLTCAFLSNEPPPSQARVMLERGWGRLSCHQRVVEWPNSDQITVGSHGGHNTIHSLPRRQQLLGILLAWGPGFRDPFPAPYSVGPCRSRAHRQWRSAMGRVAAKRERRDRAGEREEEKEGEGWDVNAPNQHFIKFQKF